MDAAEYLALRDGEDHHWWYTSLHDFVRQLADREAQVRGRSLDVLDAGCGTGRMCEVLQPVGRVSGIDLHPQAVEFARARGLRRIRQGDLAHESPGDAEYDLITCLDVLYHRCVPDDAAVLRNLASALRPGGVLLLQVPAFNCLRGSHDEAVQGVRRYRRPQLRELLADAGLRVEIIAYRLAPFFLPLLAWRSWTRLVGRKSTLVRPASEVKLSAGSSIAPLLAAVVKGENALILRGLSFPFGSSLFVQARKC